MKRRLVQWDKWKDPYGENLDEFEWPGAFQPHIPGEHKPEYMKSPEELEAEQMMREQGHYSPPPLGRRPIKIIQTPMGMVPMVEYTMPSKIFNFHVCHTNFDVGDREMKIVERVPGVEILEIQSRYRMLVGIGKIFGTADVRNAVTQALDAEEMSKPDEETKPI